MARHALSKSRRRALLRAGLTVTAVGAALGAGVQRPRRRRCPTCRPWAPTPASARPERPCGGAVTGALGHSLRNGIAPVTHLRLDPLAGTGTDPLDNAVGTQLADFKPLSTAAVTDPLTSGGALKDLPPVGPVAQALHGG